MRPTWIPVLLLGLVLAACGGDKHARLQPPAESFSKFEPDHAAAPKAAGGADATITAKTAEGSALSGPPLTPVSDNQLNVADGQAMDRKIIRNAELELQLDDPESTEHSIESIAELLGGFVVNNQMKQSTVESQPNVSITVTIRVPSTRFNDAMSRIRALPGHVLQEKVTGQDVTEEYIDLEARIRSKKALEAQFMEIMKQAKKVSDALEVQSQLGDVRTEIERLEGRRRFLENQASLSTITVTLEKTAPVVTATKAGISETFKQAFGDTVDVGVAIVMGIIRIVGIMIPILVLIVLPLYIVFRLFIRKRLVTSKAA